MNKLSLGKHLEPILQEMEAILWEHEAKLPGLTHDFTNGGFRASLKIFMASMLDYMHKDSMIKHMTQDEMEKRAGALGARLSRLVLEFTSIDTTSLY